MREKVNENFVEGKKIGEKLFVHFLAEEKATDTTANCMVNEKLSLSLPKIHKMISFPIHDK